LFERLRTLNEIVTNVLKSFSFYQTPNLSLSLSLRRDEQRVSLGELLMVDKYHF
jgi:hypothetical protein